MNDIYISPELSHSLTVASLALFFISVSISVLILFCFYKIPSSHQSGVRRYLIYVQVLSIIYDIHFDILFGVHPIFPVLGAYCSGLLCIARVPLATSFGITIALIGNVGVSMLMCLVHRYQTILLPSSRFKVDMRVVGYVHAVMVLSFSFPGVSLMLANVDERENERLIDECPFNISWIRDRGFSYAMFEHFSWIEPLVIAVSIILIFSIIIIASMCAHIIHVLRTSSIHSTENTRLIRRSVINLFTQILAPWSLIILPGEIVILSILPSMPIPFEVALVSFKLLHLHTLIHSILLIALTPSFRIFIIRSLSIGNYGTASINSVQKIDKRI